MAGGVKASEKGARRLGRLIVQINVDAVGAADVLLEFGDDRVIGEQWIFVASTFSPQDDDLLLVVKTDEDAGEWRLRLHWSEDAQEDVIENFDKYVAPLPRTESLH